MVSDKTYSLYYYKFNENCDVIEWRAECDVIEWREEGKFTCFQINCIDSN